MPPAARSRSHHALAIGTTAAMGLTRHRFPGRDLLNILLMSPLIFP
jgi:ABC-type spermidine/putrescine transport system permease subunit II